MIHAIVVRIATLLDSNYAYHKGVIRKGNPCLLQLTQQSKIALQKSDDSVEVL